jgi:hypothetical protein
MEPISRAYLRQTVTLFNLWQTAEGGRRAERTLLRHVRFGSAPVSESVSVQGRERSRAWRLLADRRNTRGVDGEGGAKPYAAPEAWAALDAGGKAGAWTLATGDWIYAFPGNMSASCPPWDPAAEREQDFRRRHSLRLIAEVSPVIDEDGSIHHWKVTFD